MLLPAMSRSSQVKNAQGHQLEEYRAPTKAKLAVLWASTMFCYAYGDYFGLYVAGTLADMNRGSMGPLGHATPGVLVAYR